MKKLVLSACTAALLALTGCSGGLFSGGVPVKLQEVWSTDNTLRTPESVVFDRERNLLYVSNINQTNKERKDGDGFISRLNTKGELEDLHWVTGLNDPKGLALFNNILYVADLDEVVAIATQTGAILGRYKAENATFLNDITIDNSGNVYVSDSDQSRIYLLRNGRVSTWVETKKERPNGLFFDNNRMIVAFSRGGKVRLLDPERKEFTDWTDKIDGGDGITPSGDGNFFVSNWNGEVYYVNQEGRNWRILDTKSSKVNAADIYYLEDQQLLLVPTFNDNRVVAYRVSY